MWPVEDRIDAVQAHPHPRAASFAYVGTERHKQLFDVGPDDIGANRLGVDGVQRLEMRYRKVVSGATFDKQLLSPACGAVLPGTAARRGAPLRPLGTPRAQIEADRHEPARRPSRASARRANAPSSTASAAPRRWPARRSRTWSQSKESRANWPIRSIGIFILTDDVRIIGAPRNAGGVLPAVPANRATRHTYAARSWRAARPGCGGSFVGN